MSARGDRKKTRQRHRLLKAESTSLPPESPRPDQPNPDDAGRRRAETCLTVREVARRLRVRPSKVRAWIRRGELAAINTSAALCGRQRLVVTPQALAAFERKRATGAEEKPQRRKRRPAGKDYYPD
jgi:excisionase family DNA binding protein